MSLWLLYLKSRVPSATGMDIVELIDNGRAGYSQLCDNSPFFVWLDCG